MEFINYTIQNFNYNDNFIGGSDKKYNDNDNNNVKFNINKVYRYQLDNSMRVILVPIIDSNIFSAGFYVGVGSRHEYESFGIAHFLEHMTFKGTKTKSSHEVNEILDNIGAVYNASTTLEYTSYYLSGNPLDYKQLMDILLDLYINPTYPQDDIMKEKNVVLEEWRMNQDNNNRILLEKLRYEMLNDKDINLHRPIIGYEDTIKQYTQRSIIEFRKNYKPDNTVLIISGNFSKKNILKIIKKYFNQKIIKTSIPNNNYNINDKFIIPFNNPKIKNNVIHINKDIKQSIIILSFRAPNFYNKYTRTINLLSDILTNGFSSRIFNLLRNKLGVSYYSNSYYYGLSDCGFFNIVIGLEPSVIENSIKEILLELKNMAINGITDKELNIAKKKNETALLFSFKEPMEFVDYYGLIELNNRPYKNIIDIYNQINNITLEDILLTSKNLFNKNNLCIGIVGKADIIHIKKLLNNNSIFV